jgi:uncharacterized protein (DUF433 family)
MSGVGTAAVAIPAQLSIAWFSGNGLYRYPPFSYLDSMDYTHLITMEPGKRSGKPCIRGLRITVGDVLEYLASGMSHEEILHDFPDLTEQDIRACLAFAADRERKTEIIAA